MIKAIVFDLGGVVFSSDGGTYEGREKLAKILSIDSEKLHKLWFEYKKDLMHGKMPEEIYLKKIISEFNINISLDELKEIIRNMNYINLNIVDLLKSLKKSYIIAALNNEVKEWNDYRIEKFNLRDYFSFIVSSCNVGLSKPDIKIYSILLNILNFNAEEIIFIDDRPENLIPAEKLGIKIIHFKGEQKLLKELSEFNVKII